MGKAVKVCVFGNWSDTGGTEITDPICLCLTDVKESHVGQQVYIKCHQLSSFSCLLWNGDLQHKHFFWEYEGDTKSEKWSSVEQVLAHFTEGLYFFSIYRVVLAWLVLRCVLFQFTFDRTCVMWEYCVTGPPLQLWVWRESLQFKGVKLPWKQNSCVWRFHHCCGKAPINIYFDGS